MKLIRFLSLPMVIALVIQLGACAAQNESEVAKPAPQSSVYFPPVNGPWDSAGADTEGWDIIALEELFDFARTHNSSGLVIIKNGRILAQRHWALENPPVAASVGYRDIWYHGDSPGGWAREDVASTQKSFISVLAAIARDKGLLDFDAPVSFYLGEGWSQTGKEQESVITVRHLLSMTSGLSEQLEFVFPAGEEWSYINKAYSLVNDVVQVASGMDPNEFTTEWLTGPLGMTETEWIVRSEFFRQWNMNGLVTTAPDLARFGLMIQEGGRWAGSPSMQTSAAASTFQTPQVSV